MQIAVSADGRFVVGCTLGGWLGCWAYPTGDLLAEVQLTEGTPARLAFSPTSRQILIATSRRTGVLNTAKANFVLCWDTDTFDKPSAVHAGDGDVCDLAFTTNPDQFCLIQSDGKVFVKSLRRGQAPRSFLAKATGLVAIAPSGRIAHLNNTTTVNLLDFAGLSMIHVWDVSTGKQIRKWAGDKTVLSMPVARPWTGLSFSPDGRRLVACSGLGDFDESHSQSTLNAATIVGASGGLLGALVMRAAAGAVEKVREAEHQSKRRSQTILRVWDVETGELLANFSDLVTHHSGRIEHALFSSAGDAILSVCTDSIQYWNLASVSHAAELAEHSVLALAFSADGKRLLFARAMNITPEIIADPDRLNHVPQHLEWIDLPLKRVGPD